MMHKPLDQYNKSDWLFANTHGEVPQEIYRIFRVDHLLSDITKQTNTLVNPSQEDSLENPLKNAQFKIDKKDHSLFFGMMAEYYTQSWSLIKSGWDRYSVGYDTIRIKSNASVLFDRLVNGDDPFYSLYYHMGLIEYTLESKIQKNIYDSNFDDFLDSRGYGLLKTILRLRDDHIDEKEIRLVYIRSPRKGYNDPLKNKVFGETNQFCAHVFNWSGIIEDYELNPNNKGDSSDIEEAISKTRSSAQPVI